MTLTNFNLLLVFFLVFFGFLKAQPIPASSQNSIDIEQELHKDRINLIDQHIVKFIEDKNLPGGVFMISYKDQIIYNKAFGDRSPGVMYQQDDIFRLASMTKALTTIGIMQLYEDGKLTLDDPIHYYIPEFKNAQVARNINQVDSTYNLEPAKNKITIRHLLTHTSGITYGSFQRGAIQAMYQDYGVNGFGLSHDSISTQEMVKILAGVPLIFEPGEKYSYGLNMEVLGAIIERVSGTSLEKYFRDNITDPLGMDDTYFILPESKHDRLVPIYTLDANRNYIVLQSDGLNYPLATGRNYFSGGGGMSGTAADYMKLTLALKNDGHYNGQQILSRNTVDLITADQMIVLNELGTGYSSKPGITYGLGFQLITDEGEALTPKSSGTFEWSGYFNTKYFIDPEEDLTFVGMTQVIPFYREDFWDKLYAIIYSCIK